MSAFSMTLLSWEVNPSDSVYSADYFAQGYLYLSQFMGLAVLACLPVSAAEKKDATTTLLHHRYGIIQVAGI